MGLCELKVQINYGPQRFRQGDMKNNMVKSKKIEGGFIQFWKEKKSCVKEIFESIKGCKHRLIASGATPIWSAGRAPDEIKARRRS
jgi:hypothetical protein